MNIIERFFGRTSDLMENGASHKPASIAQHEKPIIKGSCINEEQYIYLEHLCRNERHTTVDYAVRFLGGKYAELYEQLDSYPDLSKGLRLINKDEEPQYIMIHKDDASIFTLRYKKIRNP